MQVDSDRLWDTIMEMSEIGKTSGGGSSRLALTEDDIRGRKKFLDWCMAERCMYKADCFGNLFIRREGTDKNLDPLVIGSHLDTQPKGGKFDGILGVLAGLEIIRVLNEHNVETLRPIDVAVWTNEEGSRFSPAMSGSAAFSGLLSEHEFLSATDSEGKTLGECLDKSGFKGVQLPEDYPIGAYLELHIEQGPVLEELDIPVAVVKGVQGVTWLDIHFYGESAHAGPTPMASRKDALFAATTFIEEFRESLNADTTGFAKFTVGNLSISQPSRNVVPSLVVINADIRHVVQEDLLELEDRIHSILQKVRQKHGVNTAIEAKWRMPVINFDDQLISTLSDSVSELDIEPFSMMSGAGHDAANISRNYPTAMLFVPSKDSLSHNEKEYTSKEHCGLGAQALLNAVLKLINK